jgi:ribonuclease D
VVRELWHWRETEAIAANRPPFFILSHEALIEVAAAAATRRPIDSLLPRRISERRRDELARAIARGLKVPPEQQPQILQRISRRATDAERKRFLELQKRRDARADELGLDPTLIASRATLSDLARNWERHIDELMSWQRKLLQA